jgi:uncharacterized protein (DUF885 family)
VTDPLADPNAPASPRPPPDSADDDRAGLALAELAERIWDEHMAVHAVWATSLGDRRFDDRLRPNGPGAIEADAGRLRAARSEVLALATEGLGEADRLTHGELLDFLGRELDLVEAGLDAWNVDPLDGPQVAYLDIPSFQPIETPDEGDALIRRWREMGPWIDRLTDSTREALGRGVAAPQALARRVVAELDGVLATPDDAWPLVEPARDLPSDWSEATRERIGGAIREAVATVIRPAFERYRAFLGDELLPRAREDSKPGLSHVPGGDAAYLRLVRSHTTLELQPDAIHQIGLAETERIDAEFRELGGRLLETSDQAQILARLRSDPALHFETPEQVFAVAEESLARANAAIPSWFGRLPKAPCVVAAMKPHEAEHSTIAYYREPAADGSRPGTYYINTWAPQTRPRYEAETLAFHEAVPGHHLQIAIAQEIESVPSFRRHAGPTAYVEGWGLYSERLSVDMGLLSSDLAAFGVASYDAWRASRLVVDTGMHALGWSRDRAIDFMLEHTALAENNIANEVDRYLALPGQALAYKLGQREILRLRERARSELGPRFDIRAFHDVVLGDGALGLATLARLVDSWIVDRRA